MSTLNASISDAISWDLWNVTCRQLTMYMWSIIWTAWGLQLRWFQHHCCGATPTIARCHWCKLSLTHGWVQEHCGDSLAFGGRISRVNGGKTTCSHASRFLWCQVPNFGLSFLMAVELTTLSPVCKIGRTMLVSYGFSCHIVVLWLLM